MKSIETLSLLKKAAGSNLTAMNDLQNKLEYVKL